MLLDSQSGASYPTYILAVVMLFSVSQWDDVFQVRLAWLVALLIGYLVLSSLWSEPYAWRDTVSMFSRGSLVFLFAVAVAEGQLRGQVRRWLGRVMAVVGFCAVVAALLVHFQDPPSHGRLNGLGQLDTQVIAALVYGVCLLMVLDVVLNDHHRVWRSLAVFSALVIAYAVFLSDSRNAWVSVFAGVGVLILAHVSRSLQSFIAAAASLAIVTFAGLAALLVGETTREVLLPRGLSFRPDIWAEVLERILSNDGVWFGLGINTPDNVHLQDREFLHPHNMYLAVVYQGGIVALALFLIVLLSTVRILLQHYCKREAKLAIGILAVALPAYLLDGHELIDKVGSTWFLLWFPVGIALGLEWSSPSSLAQSESKLLGRAD